MSVYRITVLSSGLAWPAIEADSPKDALLKGWQLFGMSVPAWAAIINAARVCRSTHRVAGGGVTKFGYDQRFNFNNC